MKINKVILLLIFTISFFSCSKKTIEVDILIKNGIVYNGTDSIASNVSIAIRDDKIIFIGDENSVSLSAAKIINAAGLIVSPGFIDPHTHADGDLADSKQSHNQPFLFQGVTTVVVGNDGNSLFPTSKYNDIFKENGIGTNVIQLIGHGTIRKQAMGNSDELANEQDIVKMQNLIQNEMDAGAFGMSTGLFYAPGSYSNTDEVIALAETVAKNNGIYDTHLRDESSFTIGLIPAIEEAIEIGRQAKLPIHISHIKCLGVDVWNQSNTVIQLIEKAQKEGIKVTANQYPYEASATGLKSAVVPRWAESGGKDSLFIRYNNQKLKKRILDETNANITRRGGPDKLLIVKAVDFTIVGKTLLEISETLHISPEETVFKIIASGYIKVASFNMNATDITNFMKQDWVVTGSDGGSGHPRKYGSFPRKYRKYVIDDKIIDHASFINNSSATTAEIYKIPNRGKLQVGYYADIIIFNPETFKDIADYTDAFQYAKGLEYSIINGKLSIENGKFTNELNGKVLTK